MNLTTESGVFFGIIVGTFFGTLWASWDAFLIYSILMLVASIVTVFREINQRSKE